MRSSNRILFVVLISLAAAGEVSAQQLVNAYPNLTFSEPVFLTNCADGTNRVFVVQQGGVIKVFQNDSTAAATSTFLNVTSKLSATSGEQGLLGLAFHPNYIQNGYFFVDYTAPSPLRTVVARYKVLANNPNAADPASEFKIIEIPQPYTNHNGGMLAFGPDGYLYIGMGDGGSEGDPQNNGQSRTTLLGKILRIDVNDTTATTHYVIPADNPYASGSSGFRKEIWAYGFRNPWRFSFDLLAPSLWVGDVGQTLIEEVDIVEGGANYGWNIMEGSQCYNPPTGCNTTGLTLPVKTYPHTLGNAVVGGYVYHGHRRPGFRGAYIYGDYGTGRIWLFRLQGGQVIADSQIVQAPSPVSSFGLDEYQELYVVSYLGANAPIYRFAGAPYPASAIPAAPIVLEQNFPNPFNPSTSIRYVIPTRASVSVEVYDLSGRLVARLVDARQEKGPHSIAWNGTDYRGNPVSSGVYLYRLTAGGETVSKKMVLLR